MTSRSHRARRVPRRTAQPQDPVLIPETTPTAAIKDTHKWADYVEFRCLISLDRYVSLADAASWFRMDPEEEPDNPSGSDPRIAQVQDEDEVGNENAGVVGGEDAATRVDNRRRLAEDVFRLLEDRAASYGERYPFNLSESSTQLHCVEDLSRSQKAYVFFLLCALGRYVRRHQTLTGVFERVSAAALRSMLPTADVHVFGTARTGEGRYDGGNFKTKVRRLAEDLGEVPGHHVESIHDSETGDRGLDAVGWISLGDSLPSRLVVFAQAACTDDWETKQDSPGSDAWDQLILVTCAPVVVCCIPHCFRNAAGNWHDQTKIHRRLLLDRRRMMHLLPTVDHEIDALLADDEVTPEFLGFRLPA